MAAYTEQEKKSLIATTLIFGLLLLALILIKYSEKTELADLEGGGGGGGVTVNFGDSDVGSGADFKSEVLEVKQTTKQQPPVASAPEEEIIGSDLEDAPAIANTKPVTKKEPKKEDAKPQPVKAPQPSKSTSDALSNLLNGNAKGGDGDDGVAGNKGKSTGSLSSGSYDGDGGSGGGRGGGNGSGDGTGTGPGSGSGSGGGSGSGRGTGVGNYNLAGRKVLTKPAPRYTCNEQGTVVIQITVDDSGKVIKAERGRGTTNSAQCLFDQAKQAALNTKFDKGSVAAQVGTIKYNFTLTE
ncbi:energy transducer TonB [Flavobacterium sp. Sd200]|uniref:energy transducer TonB family protein n=1 Tax=Flavobacterium sp. Sd200 TaxID=2692211 RepID=UPI00136A22A5|nr:energy transducer TonB [Flavobacterium sp. Sd200]MXN92945.1 energy transducer TonB [Flavobacterium sp. Sd200]